MSLCRVNPFADPMHPESLTSSCMTAPKWKSSTPPPPNSSGTLYPRKPWRPACSQMSRGVMPSRSHWSWFGATSLSSHERKAERNCSCSGE